MGTGVSRLNVLMSCGRFQPVGHRIDKMQSKGLQTNTPSTKLLLLDNNNNDQEDGVVTAESSNNIDVTASCKTTSNNIICCSSSQEGLLVALDSTKDKERESILLDSKEDRGGRDNNFNVIIVNNNHDKEEQKQEEDERNLDYEGSLWIRPPSFRDYVRVVHSDDDDDDVQDSLNNINDGKTNELVEKDENQLPATKEYGNNEACIIRRGAKAITSTSKGRKQRRIRKVFSEKSSGMKHLWKVNIWYNPKVPHSATGEAPAQSS